MKIRVIGVGIRGVSQLTIEALEAMRAARKVFSLSCPPALFLSFGLADIEDISELYRDKDKDEDNYQRIMDKVWFEAQRHKDIALLVPGHPRLGVTILQWLEQMRTKARFTLEVVEGISSFDTLINDLKRDPLERGSVILDVNRLLLFQLTLEPVLDYYLYHICSIGTNRTNVSNPAKDNALHLLKEKLLDYYPQHHKVILIHSAEHPGEVVHIIDGIVGELEKLLPQITFSSSLFIPGVRPKVIDRNYLQRLRAS